MRTLCGGLLVLLFLAVASCASAGETLLFAGGFTLEVQSWSIEDGGLWLHFGGDAVAVVDPAVLLEARHADGPPGMITWRRAIPSPNDERLARATAPAVDSMRPAPDPTSLRPLPVPARTIKRGPLSTRSAPRDKAPDPDLEPGTE